MPRTILTAELKTDLQLLKHRNVLDPRRHYKKDYARAIAPEFCQLGEVIEGPTEYLSSRLLKRERKRTFVEEVLRTEDSNMRFKNKYKEIQASKTSGKRAFYKDLREKRSRRTHKSQK